MKSSAERKAAIRDYKLRKVDRGVFSVRCIPNDRIWVGSSLNLHGAKNALWFILTGGNHMNRSLQGEWNSHGAEAFDYNVVEKVGEDISDLRVGDVLKALKDQWIARLGAHPL